MNNYRAFPDHFSLAELSATSVPIPNIPTGHKLSTLRSVAWILECVRSHVQKPLYINSGYRNTEVNAKVGGVKNSFHTLGAAVDISIRNLNAHDRVILENSLLSYKPCEFIKYDTFWHVAFDISKLAISGMPVTWQDELPDFYEVAEVVDGSEDTDL